jgi:hypothetical protein
MTYRAFLPLLNQIAPFGIWTLLLTCHIGAFAILWFTYRIVSNQVGDKVSAALACCAVAACYAGQYGFHDFYFGVGGACLDKPNSTRIDCAMLEQKLSQTDF